MERIGLSHIALKVRDLKKTEDLFFSLRLAAAIC